jgi:hypothetical protein
MKFYIPLVATLLCFLLTHSLVYASDSQPEGDTETTDLPAETDSDTPGGNKKFKFLSKKPENLLLVPIPTSNPTFGTGLVLGGAYFYRQTEEQKESQPASFTGVAAGYTDNESWFAGVLQQNYWKEDKWRFTGVAGYLDIKLELNPAGTRSDDTGSLDWLESGSLVHARLSRKLIGKWYLGVMARYLDISQTFGRIMEDDGLNLQSDISAPGVGLNLDFDSRDVSFNPYQGRFFELKAMTSSQSGSDADSYQTYRARLRSYHSLTNSLVLAWDINGCSKSGQIPLWDTCRLALRGFPATDYMGKQSLYAQAEARWRFHKKWGLVAFAGAGRVNGAFSQSRENDTIPSYGAGIRFMVLESQRINVRVDYARSDKGNDAWYLSVTESF